MRPTLIAALVAALGASTGAALAADGYAGQQTRDIKSLSAGEIADLTAGRGMGLAKPAELNHYPGPAHVLELQQALGLTADQVRAVEASFARMSAAAKELGAALIDRERVLDRSFADRNVTPASLSTATGDIGVLQGRLRAVHLAAHLEMRDILTAAQVAQYDALRGYTGNTPPSAPPIGHHHHGG